MKHPIELRRLKADNSDEVSELQNVLESAPAYWQRVSGKTIGPEGATQTFAALPDGKTHDDKFVSGAYRDGFLIGCADLIRGFPDRQTAMLGLLLISGPQQRAGLGQAVYQAIEAVVRTWPGTRKVRIGVIATNSIVLPFWRSLGFRETGVRRPYQDNGIVSETIVLEKELTEIT